MDRSLLLTDLLSRVSRSFYLTLRVLPSVMREPIGLAYLLARASDTIADTELVPSSRRLELLRAYGNALRYQGQAVHYADARYTSGIAVRFKPEAINEGQLAGAITGASSPLSKPNGS